MNTSGEMPLMQIYVTVPDEVLREANTRNVEIVEFVEKLITKGLAATLDRTSVDSAIDRIRALRPPTGLPIRR
jgi:hypothetical protein